MRDLAMLMRSDRRRSPGAAVAGLPAWALVSHRRRASLPGVMRVSPIGGGPSPDPIARPSSRTRDGLTS